MVVQKTAYCFSRSNAEAEYRAVANTVAEVIWLQNLLLELHVPLHSATIIYCDNISAAYLSDNPVQHQRTKHVKIDIHFVREQVRIGRVRVLHVPSEFQYTDIFTKGLARQLFTSFRSSLSVHSSTARTAGNENQSRWKGVDLATLITLLHMIQLYINVEDLRTIVQSVSPVHGDDSF
ncbi:hypothetical protein L1987_13094 [Smallanthus sonchifolius]|uniref:Uncharacterized protein n=1 Tax=Smallanthus sonchifolius TaxID=185202 RepID=A0ACB9JH56_9ASTR|nr:hypothetical protein L1987_13094 [Smallanthus sonchifolius]